MIVGTPVMFGMDFVVLQNADGMELTVGLPMMRLLALDHCMHNLVNKRVAVDSELGILTPVFEHPWQHTRMGISYHVSSHTFTVHGCRHRERVGR